MKSYQNGVGLLEKIIARTTDRKGELNW